MGVGSSSDAPAAVGSAAFKEAVKGFDIVILGLGVIAWDVSQASAIDAACRESGSCFFLTTSAGELAFFFSNLNEHVMLECSGAQGGGAGTTASTETSGPVTTSFSSFQEWVDCTPSQLQKDKVDPSVLFVALFLAFRRQAGAADADAGDKFQEYCSTVAKCEPEVNGFPSFKDAYSLFFMEPLVHVASIVGGLMAQEVIKAITQRDPPMPNTVCFNAFTGAALIEQIPLQQNLKKRKVEEVALDLDD